MTNRENIKKISKYLKSIKYKLVFRSPINLFYQKLDKKNKVAGLDLPISCEIILSSWLSLKSI